MKAVNETARAAVSSRKALLEVLDGNIPYRRPIWFMRQAGRYLPEYRKLRAEAGSFLALCRSSELAAEVTLQPLRRLDLDAAIVFADILLIAEALGSSLDFRENEGPVLSRVGDADSVARLDRKGLDRLVPVYDTLRRVKLALPANVALVGFCGAPWTVASYMIEGGSSAERLLARRAAYAREAWFESLIALLAQVSVDYLARQVEAGAEAVQIFDSWAGDLDDDLRQRYCVAPIRVMVEELARRGIPKRIIGFARGIGAGHADFAASTGVSAVGVESAVPVAWIAKELVPRVAVQGNLDPFLLQLGGDAMRRGVSRLVKSLKPSRHIFNLGHGVKQETPPEHLLEVVELVRRLDGQGA